jgi:hypothetical protein
MSKIVNKEFEYFLRTRMEVTSDYNLSEQNPILGLNEFFMGPKQVNTTLVYNFKQTGNLIN